MIKIKKNDISELYFNYIKNDIIKSYSYGKFLRDNKNPTKSDRIKAINMFLKKTR